MTRNEQDADFLRFEADLTAKDGWIVTPNIARMCRAFGGYDWIGKFTQPRGEPAGWNERALAMCLAADILESGDAP